jgi:hypothetical protein
MQVTLSIVSDVSLVSSLMMNPTLLLWQGIIDLQIPRRIIQIDKTYLLSPHASINLDPTVCNRQRMLQFSQGAFLKLSHRSPSTHNRLESANQSKKIQLRPGLKMAKYEPIPNRSRTMVALIHLMRQAMLQSDF